MDEQAASEAEDGAETVELDELSEEAPITGVEKGKLDAILDIPVTISMEVGRRHISIRNILHLNKGSVVNMGSIHAKLTKPAFISYATSKTALLGLTQSIAVDCGSRIRVNAIQPAATATEMLLAGFEGKPEAFRALKKFHPTNSIAEPLEIAKAVEFLLSDSIPFTNGAVLDINGGIGFRLHDPI